jgi:hypothetical protein
MEKNLTGPTSPYSAHQEIIPRRPSWFWRRHHGPTGHLHARALVCVSLPTRARASALSSPSRPNELAASSACFSGAVPTTARIPGPRFTSAGGEIKTRPCRRYLPIVLLPLFHKHHRAAVGSSCSATTEARRRWDSVLGVGLGWVAIV